MEKIEMPQRIETERLVLAIPMPATFQLAEEFFAVVEHSRAKPWRAMSWLKSVEDAFLVYLINVVQKNWEAKTMFSYLIRDKEINQIVGQIDLKDINEKNFSAELGFWLAPTAVGKGYMTEAIRAVEKAGFEAGLNRIQLRNDTENARSVAVAKRCGYHLDGVLRQVKWSPSFNDFRDLNVWSKLKSEWEAEQTSEHKI